MRIRIDGTLGEVDLAVEVLCVLGTVAAVATYPGDDPGLARRYVTVRMTPEVLEDLGVLRPTLPVA